MPVTEDTFALDEADRVCTAPGGGLKPFEGQFEESEMFDVVQLAYRLVASASTAASTAASG
ncbi:MAG: hypothetical protein AAF645_12560 [Myxococcota bacterium]